MSDRIAVMNAGQGRAARDARGALRAADHPVRGRLHRHDQPAARDRSRRTGVVRLAIGRDRAVRRSTGLTPGAEVELSVRPEAITLRAGRGRSARSAAASSRPPISATPSPIRSGPAAASSCRSSPPRPGSDSRPAAMSPSPGPPRTRSSSATDRSARWRRSRMNHDYDGSSIDLEQALDRYMLERRISRRQLLERIGAVGAGRGPRPDHRRLHVGGASATPAPSASAAASARRRRPRRGCRPDRDRRADADPLPRGRALRLQLDRVHRREHHPVVREEVRHQGHATTSSRTPTRPTRSSATTAAATTCRSRSRSTSRPSSPRAPSSPLDKSLHPEHRRTSARSGPNPSYDPGNAHSMPYMWWTTGVGYDTTRSRTRSTSSKALWDPRYAKHIAHARRLPGSLRHGAHPAGLRRQHVDHRPSSTRRSRCSSSRSRSSASTRPTPAR